MIYNVYSLKNKVSHQTNLVKNPSNLPYIFILSVKFENLTMFLLYPSCLQNFKKIKDQLLCHQINVIISSFCSLKLCIKNKFIDHIVNKI